MQSSDTPQLPPLTLLCVDDEEGILRSMKRLFHRTLYKVLTATSGEQALEILAQEEVQVIVSDMRMPGMSGAEFLAKVAEDYPDTYRIILSGYSDFDAVIATVNQGKIHRFLEKPWDNNSLMQTIEAGFDYAKVKLDNQLLQAQITQQNQQLQRLNQDLEAKVEQRTRQIRAALHKLEQSNASSHKVLFNLISINPLIDGVFGRNVSALALRLGQQWGLDRDELKSLGLAGLLVEIGKLGLEPTLVATPYFKLNYEQQQEYLRQTQVAQLILAPAPHLQPVSDLLTHQFQHFHAADEMDAPEHAPPSDAQCILAIARDYWRYRDGRLTEIKLDEEQPLKEMRKHRGSIYHPEILDLFAEQPQLAVDKHDSAEVSVGELAVGMRLSRNIFNQKHILLLPEDHILTESTLTKLQKYDDTQSEPLQVWVNREDLIQGE